MEVKETILGDFCKMEWYYVSGTCIFPEMSTDKALLHYVLFSQGPVAKSTENNAWEIKHAWHYQHNGKIQINSHVYD